MPPSAETSPFRTLQIATPSGPLELLACLPKPSTKQHPLLFIHGAHCAASCFQAVLPLTALAGYASYALSLRGHGQSWQPSRFTFHALTSIDLYVADVKAGIDFVAGEHPDNALVLVGHSMGGGVLQRTLAMPGTQKQAIAGLVLLASAPLSGGGLDVARNWQAAEAAIVQSQAQQARSSGSAAEQGWVDWLRSFLTINSGLDTPTQVRNKFFSPETPEDVVQGWIRDCKSRLESVRVSIESFWPLADPVAVLAAIESADTPIDRKVLCISAKKDVLISSEVSRKNFDAYRAVCQGEEEIMHTELSESAHHIMLDGAGPCCASLIIKWIEGKGV